MEMETLSCSITSNINEEDDHARLPGFRFHPTDEELVGFYLGRKVQNKPIRIELIKHADIYKYDPWELPKFSTVGDNEWYFFCKRGRKYKNSIRPNRVTGSGFWKATGIDRPIYSSAGGEGIIGLKKTLVFYRGSAGKGSKTDWMMHEFRLPSGHHDKTTFTHMDATTIAQEAEVWTLCRILKRNVSYRKMINTPQEMSAKRSVTNPLTDHANSKTCSLESSNQNSPSNYISFSAPIIRQNAPQNKPYSSHIIPSHEQFLGHFSPSSQPPSTSSTSLTSPVLSCADINELLKYADWEDLRSIVDRSASVATNPSYL